jgi:hypothetical protein
MLIDRQFSAGGRVVHLIVESTACGWDLQEECDGTVVHVEHHHDWHRIERAMRLLELEAAREGVRSGLVRC